jgi:hypothetical protein
LRREIKNKNEDQDPEEPVRGQKLPRIKNRNAVHSLANIDPSLSEGAEYLILLLLAVGHYKETTGFMKVEQAFTCSSACWRHASCSRRRVSLCVPNYGGET